MADNPTALDAPALLKALIACPSVTPVEGGAMDVVGQALAGLGFDVTRRTFSTDGNPDVDNLFATIGGGAPHLVFAGHTDVVPPGDEAAWHHPPFAAEEADGEIFGRGAVDMKGGIACFIAAVARYLEAHGAPAGRVSLLITGDEEGPAINGTVRMLDWALGKGYRFDAALVGEPTSRDQLGDTVKNGRRGSISGTLIVTGEQGHVAYPHLAHNPVPRMVTALSALTAHELDRGSDDFEPTNLEVTSVDTGNPAVNVIPGAVRAEFNIRFNDHWTPVTLKTRIAEVIVASGVPNAEVRWKEPVGDVFLTRDDVLLGHLGEAIRAETGFTPIASTGGGGSDGRFFKDHCPVIEFGLVGTTMHQINERVSVRDLEALTRIYAGLLERFFAEART